MFNTARTPFLRLANFNLWSQYLPFMLPPTACSPHYRLTCLTTQPPATVVLALIKKHVQTAGWRRMDAPSSGAPVVTQHPAPFAARKSKCIYTGRGELSSKPIDALYVRNQARKTKIRPITTGRRNCHPSDERCGPASTRRDHLVQHCVSPLTPSKRTMSSICAFVASQVSYKG